MTWTVITLLTVSFIRSSPIIIPRNVLDVPYTSQLIILTIIKLSLLNFLQFIANLSLLRNPFQNAIKLCASIKWEPKIRIFTK